MLPLLLLALPVVVYVLAVLNVVAASTYARLVGTCCASCEHLQQQQQGMGSCGKSNITSRAPLLHHAAAAPLLSVHGLMTACNNFDVQTQLQHAHHPTLHPRP